MKNDGFLADTLTTEKKEKPIAAIETSLNRFFSSS